MDQDALIEEAIDIENEEDEEYRVRSAVITAIASCRAKDGLSPPLVLSVLERILHGEDESGLVNLVSLEEDQHIRKKRKKPEESKGRRDVGNPLSTGETMSSFGEIDELPYISSGLIADALLSLCFINVRPAVIDDPTTGKQLQSRANHPCIPLMSLAYRWLEWDLFKEAIRKETELQTMTGIGNDQSIISTCAITALYSLALLRQVTTETSADNLVTH